jgi:hypothetical protein
LVLQQPASSSRVRDPPVGATGDPRGRRTCPPAPYLPRPRHLLVAGGNGHAGRALQRGRRPHPRPPPALAPAHRTTRAPMTDLNMLSAQGARIVGRLGRVIDGVAQFSGSLANVCALADLKMNRFLNRADEWATASGLDNELPPAHRFARSGVGRPLLACWVSESSRLFPAVSVPRAESVLIPGAYWSRPIASTESAGEVTSAPVSRSPLPAAARRRPRRLRCHRSPPPRSPSPTAALAPRRHLTRRGNAFLGAGHSLLYESSKGRFR